MYKGTSVTFPCGQGGLNANSNPYDIPPAQLTNALNIRYYGDTWLKAPGYSVLNIVPLLAGCVAGFDFHPTTGVNRQITVWNDGKVYKEISNNFDSVELLSGVDTSEPISLFETAQVGSAQTKSCYLFGKNIAPKCLDGDGTEFVGITNESGDWATTKPYGAFPHDLRSWAFGVEQFPHLLYGSTITDTGDFTGTGASVWSVRPDIGDIIMGGISYLETVMLVFKYPVGVVAVDTADLSATYLKQQLVRHDIGLGGPGLLTKVGSDIMFVSATGRLFSISAARPDIDPIQADITEILNLSDFLDQNIDFAKLKFGRLLWDPFRQELHFCFTSRGSSTNNNKVLVFDMSQSNNPKASVDDRGLAATWLKQEQGQNTKVLTAGADGFVYLQGSANKSIDGIAYTSVFEYPETDLSPFSETLGGVKKRFDWLEIYYVPSGTYELKVDVTVNSENTKTLQFDMSDEGDVFDDAIFDEAIFGGQSFFRRKQRIGMIGHTIQLRGYNSGVNEDFEIIKIVLHFKPLTEEYEA